MERSGAPSEWREGRSEWIGLDGADGTRSEWSGARLLWVGRDRSGIETNEAEWISIGVERSSIGVDGTRRSGEEPNRR
eukprot:3237569-Pleurochrysis_carterae.AAC.1